MPSLKVIFAGTPDFSVPALQALIDSRHQVSLILTQPDRPAGRGMKLKASPVKQLALAHDIPVLQPETLKDPAVQSCLAEVQADVMVVAAYGLIIPTVVLKMPRLGCYNIHASLLPRWRGAAPIQRALLAGDRETGVTIMEVVPALDAGAMVSKGVLPIDRRATAQSLHDGLAMIGGRLMVEAMDRLSEQGRLEAEPQDERLVTYAEKLQKAEAEIDWHNSAELISRQVRAFNPFPVAQSKLREEVCRIWMATAVDGVGRPGEIVAIADTIRVGTGAGLLAIEELQLPGGKRLKVKDFMAGRRLNVGDRFGD